MISAGRSIAVKAIEGFRRNHYSLSEECFDHALKLFQADEREKSFAYRLFYSAIQNMTYIDRIILDCSGKKLKDITPQVLDILRISVCQMKYLDSVPDYSAVSQAVELCKKKNPRAAGFTNAVLRKAADYTPDLSRESKLDLLSVRYSHPKWLCAELIESVGYESAEKILNYNNGIPPIWISGNSIRYTEAELEEKLENADKLSCIDYCWSQKGLNESLATALKTADRFYVQDPAAKAAVLALDVKPGNTVIDVCAAPGGKSIYAAMLMKNKGIINAFDVSEKKAKLIIENTERLGIDIIHCNVHNAETPIEALKKTADAVICDVPCSAVGVIGKNPEIRFKHYEEIKDIPELQYNILKSSSEYVKPGGTIVYSTCSVRKAENQSVTDRFLRENEDFSYEDFSLCFDGSQCSHLTIYPYMFGTDGFYIAKMRRKG